MTQHLCIERSWGAGLTQSIQSPHPFLSCLHALTGETTTDKLTSYLIQATMKELLRVARFPEDWDDAGSSAPRPSAVANASARLVEICGMAIQSGPWVAPHVSASETGDITFEWWNGQRKLTVYFGDTGLEVIEVWGPDIQEQMRVVQLNGGDAMAQSWAWLYGH